MTNNLKWRLKLEHELNIYTAATARSNGDAKKVLIIQIHSVDLYLVDDGQSRLNIIQIESGLKLVIVLFFDLNRIVATKWSMVRN